MDRELREMRAWFLKRCENEEELYWWVRAFAEIDVPRKGVCAGHCGPFEYLKRAYFEPGKDLVVWAPRGGGKTKLGAVATMLDLVHKDGAEVRILAGSLEQAGKMWEHLVEGLSGYEDALGEAVFRGRRIGVGNGSGCRVLTQSEKSVRGVRVQKLRCDEVELFDPKVWEAAQLVTRSKKFPVDSSQFPVGDGTVGDTMAGAVEAISTLHSAFGLMNRVVENARAKGVEVLQWCLMEVLERCPAERVCEGCALWEECGGKAKGKEAGFVSIGDAIEMKKRVSKETWEAEMLCRRPSVKDCVFPSFEEAVHVVEEVGWEGAMSVSLDFGFAAPFVCLWIRRDGTGRVFVVDEYVQEQRTIMEHVEMMEGRVWGKVERVTCDPAGTSHSDQTAVSNVQYLRSRGYVVKHRKSLILEGLEMVRHALRPALGEVKLFIHPRCGRLIKAMKGYHYSAGGSELPVKDGEHDHLIDALRYHYVNAGSLAPAKRPWRY